MLFSMAAESGWSKRGDGKCLMILLLNLVLIACDPSQAYPPILNKPIKGDKAVVENRKRKLIQCCHIGRGAKRSRKLPTSLCRSQSEIKV